MTCARNSPIYKLRQTQVVRSGEHRHEVRYRRFILAEAIGKYFDADTKMRHRLYAAALQLFAPMLTNVARKAFDDWRDRRVIGRRSSGGSTQHDTPASEESRRSKDRERPEGR